MTLSRTTLSDELALDSPANTTPPPLSTMTLWVTWVPWA